MTERSMPSHGAPENQGLRKPGVNHWAGLLPQGAMAESMFGRSRWVAIALCVVDDEVEKSDSQEPLDLTNRSPPKYKLIARLEGAHGVNDVNSIAWCPRKGYGDLIATVGDDGVAKILKIVPV